MLHTIIFSASVAVIGAAASPRPDNLSAVAGFDTATSVVASEQPDHFVADLDADWTVGGKPNGGYLLATLARAGVQRVLASGKEHRDPVAASANYLRAPDLGPAVIKTEVLRTGRTASQVRTSLIQGELIYVDAVITFGTLDRGGDPRWSREPSLEIPDESECFRLPSLAPGGTKVAILDGTEVRVDPAGLGWAIGKPGGHGELRAWMRFADGQEFDPFSLLYAVDALPPATFDLGSSGWVPTMQLSAYIRSVPAAGPLQVRQRARVVRNGMVDEVCDVWDSSGNVVAQATQLAQVRFLD